MRIGELFVSLGVRTEVQKINQFASAMRRGVIESAAFVAGLYGITTTLKGMFQGTMESARSFRDFDSVTNDSVDSLQRWQIAAEKYGVARETMTRSFLGLREAMESVREGGQIPEGFMRLGVDMGADVATNLKNILDTLASEYSDRPMRAAMLLGTMRIDRSLMNMPDSRGKEFRDAFPSGNELSMLQSQRESAIALDKEMIALSQSWRKVSQDFITLIIPTFSKVLHQAERLLNAKIIDASGKAGTVFERAGYYSSRMGPYLSTTPLGFGLNLLQNVPNLYKQSIYWGKDKAGLTPDVAGSRIGPLTINMYGTGDYAKDAFIAKQALQHEMADQQ